jgi:hypothetical protein
MNHHDAFVKRILIIAAAVTALVVLWLVGARQLVLLVDAFATTGDAAAATGPFTYSPGGLSVGDKPFDLAGPNLQRDASIDADAAGRVVLHAGGKDFVLGARSGPADASMWFDVPFTPDPGDEVSLRVSHSLLPWPTPLELNFITGHSPSWKRNIYYTISWRKRGGAELELTWRYEQWHYDDWGSPTMTRANATGLIGTRITGG